MKTSNLESTTKHKAIKRVKSALRKQEFDIDFTNVNYVLGTRDAITPWSSERRCALCDYPVYTSLEYPEDVRILCDQCWSLLPEADS